MVAPYTRHTETPHNVILTKSGYKYFGNISLADATKMYTVVTCFGKNKQS